MITANQTASIVVGLMFCGVTVEEAVAKNYIQFPVDIALPDCKSVGGPWFLESFPREDLPCPCGDPSHFLVKYES